MTVPVEATSAETQDPEIQPDSAPSEVATYQPQGPLLRREGRANVVTDEGLKAIELLAAGGHPDAKIAAALGLHRTTFRDVRERQEEVDEALARGRASLELELTSILLAKARGGSLTSAIYLTKALCGWRDHGAASGPSTPRVNINISIPPPMTDAEFAKVISGEVIES